MNQDPKGVVSTLLQREVWSVSRKSPEASAAFNESVTLWLEGTLEVASLGRALTELVARHEALRATFSADGLSLHVADPQPSFPMTVHDWSGGSDLEKQWGEFLRAETERPFDLHHGPLFRAQLVKTGATSHRLVLTAHHIVCDGWSSGVITRELGALYSAQKRGVSADLPRPPSFTTYAKEQAQIADAPARAADEAYWTQLFADDIPVLELPIDKSRPPVKTYPSRRVEVRLEASLLHALRTTGAHHHASLFATMLSGFQALLMRLAGQEDVVVGIPAAGQALGQNAGLVGHAVNTVPIRSRMAMAAPFGELLENVRTRMLEAVEHQALTYGTLLRSLPLPRDPSRLPVVSVCFNLEKAMHGAFEGLHTRITINPRQFEAFDFFINVVEEETGLTLQCQYNTDLLDEATVLRWLGGYELLLRAVSERPGTPLNKLPILSAADQAQLTKWNDASARPGIDKGCVHDLIVGQAQRTPRNIAVEFEGKQLTYAELDARSNQLARRLREAGVGRGEYVGLCVDRSIEMIVGVVGILKAGAAYIPLDPAYPAERLQFMVSDSAMRVLVTDSRLLNELELEAATAVLVDAPSTFAGDASALPVDEKSSREEDIAYVIYTSGSTGKPKGVLVPHRAAANLIQSVHQTPGMSAKDVVLAVTTLSFDIAVSEVLVPLTVGAHIVVASREVASDGAKLLKAINDHKVTFLDATPATYRLLLGAGWGKTPGLLAICTGEAMPKDLAIELIPRCDSVWNGYGPTETTVWSTFYEVKPPVGRILIGRAVANTQLYVLDPAGNEVPIGVKGELFIGGSGVTHGYLNRPELSRERFVPDPFSPGRKMYKTGDVVRYLPDGNMECLGRNDFQVKLRGFRIELGEIEDALSQHPAVRQAAVVVREDRPGDKRLVAYTVTTAEVSDGDLRGHLKRTLPDYMVPSGWVRLAKMPLTPSGKIDRKQLPVPDRKRPDLGHELQSPRTSTEKKVCAQWAEILDLDAVGLQDNFFDLGGSSVLAVQAATRLAKELGIEVSPVQLFDSPTPGALSAWIDSSAKGQTRLGSDAAARAALGTRTGGRLADIAIIGMAGRFPGANDVESMWKNLLAGVESVSFFKLEEVDPLVPARELNDPAYVRARSILENVDQFDAAFFGISPKEAEVMDPQQRLFLEACWEALERSGYSPETAGGLVGVFGGVYTNSYFATHVTQRPDLSERMGAFNVLTANEKDYVATRVAHRMNLRGPALSIHTACSTSLVAVCEAAKSLQVGECDVALAGGASVNVPVKSGHVYVEGGMLSADGHCRPFDEKASGTTFSDGVGVVVLKRVDDAVRDGDHIYAVVRGTALNNDGGNKASFTAPNAEGQSAVIALAHARAQVNPRQIGYVEAHGTATPLGDPIEVTGLTRAFRAGTKDNQFCVLGSVKSNFGHLVTAAGVTGLIKASLSLENEVIPPTLHFEKPNPKIQFEKTPFFVSSALRPWPRTQTPRFAGVSSFGVGGTNAHVVIQEAPITAPSSASRPRQLLLLSARSKAALDEMSKRLATFLRQHPEVPLADVAWTLQSGRSIFPHRRAVVAETPADAVAALENGDPARVFTRHDDADTAEVAFVFPGQGSQFVGMGKALYAKEPLFKETVDRCAELLKPHLGRDLRDLLYAPSDKAAAATETLKDTAFTQPALFVTSYAMARLWMRLGVQPAAMMGHSVGEFVAACLAGVFSEADALKLVALRGRLMGAQIRGSMLTVRLPAEEVEKKLAAWPTLTVASDNAPALCVVAGPTPDVERFQKEMEGARVQVRMLVTSHAFHSQMMDPAVAPFLEAVSAVKLSEPSIPIVSTATGNWLTPAEAKDPQYWARHLRARVQFSSAVRTLLLKSGIIALEVGPRGTMTALTRQQVKDKTKQLTVASMADEEGEGRDYLAFLAAMGQLWNGGARPDWKAFVQSERRLRVPLPTYPFERKRFWAELPGDRSVQVHVQAARAAAGFGVAAGVAPGRNEVSGAAAVPASRGAATNLINEQLRLMQQQLALLANRRNKGS